MEAFQKSSSVLLEVDPRITTPQYHIVVAPTAYNFVSWGRGVAMVPSRGVDHNLIARLADIGGLTREEVNRLLRVFVKEHHGFKPGPWIITFKGESFEEYYVKRIEVENEIIEKTGQPILSIIGVDTLIDLYGARRALPALTTCITRAREMGGLCVVTLKPGYPRLKNTLSISGYSPETYVEA